MSNFHNKIGSAVEELKSTRLWNRLNDLNSARAENACDFVVYIEPYLNSIHEYFPLYTRHDCHHSYEVLDRMGTIIRDELLEDGETSLSDDEIFCLIIAAYAHDVGMIVFETGEKREELFNKIGIPLDIDKENELLTNHLRRNHAERGMNFLRVTDASNFIPEYLRGLIGLIMEGHNLSPEILIHKIPDTASIGRIISNPISLSTVLCCADALEFSDTRVLDSAFEEAKRREDHAAQFSLKEMMKHRSIGCGIAISADGFIFATGDFRNAEILHATHKTLDQIELWLKDYILYDKKLKRPLLKLFNPSIIRESFTLSNFEYFPIAIKLDEFQVRELLTSKNLWGGSESLPVRELVQNSIDACRYKSHIKPGAIEYNPKIEIIVSYEDKSIVVKDNGIGMSKDDIVQYFLQVGHSKTRSSDFTYNAINQGFNTLARFGIGFWSVFSIAKQAEIITKYNNFYGGEQGVTFNVTVNPVMPYLELKYCEVEEGTLVKLTLKDDIDISRIIEELTRSITVSQIPCKIVSNEGEVLYEFPKKLKIVETKDIFGYRAEYAESKGMKLFQYHFETDDIEISLGIAYSKIGNDYRCLTPEGEAMFNYLPPNSFMGTSITSVCGLTTNFNFEAIPFAISRVGKVLVDIKNPKGLIYSISRKSLIENDRFLELQKEINQHFKDALINFYREINVYGNPSKIRNLIDDSKSNGGEAGDAIIANLYKYYIENYPVIVPIKLLYWKKGKNEEVSIEYRDIFLEDFWEIKINVYYACIWPDRYDSSKKDYFLRALLNSIEDQEGYILWAYQEAASIVEVAKSAEVININHPYFDWHQRRNQLIKIQPWLCFEYQSREVLKLQSKWTGHLLEIDFVEITGSLPWYNFGRHIMYVDINHELIKYLINLSKTGKIWECGELLSLMSANDESSIRELHQRTNIKPYY
jgi:hypothetical protein